MFEHFMEYPTLLAVLDIALRIFGAAIGAWIAALFLILVTRWVAGFWLGFWKSYLVVFSTASVALCLQYAIARSHLNLNIRNWQALLSVLVGFFIHLLFFRHTIYPPRPRTIGWIRIVIISLLHLGFAIVLLRGMTICASALTEKGNGWLVLFDFAGSAGWLTQPRLVLVSLITLALVLLMVLVPRRGEPSWLMVAIAAMSSIPCGFGFLVIVNQILENIHGLSQPRLLTRALAIALHDQPRLISVYAGAAALLIFLSGCFLVYRRRHRLTTFLQVGARLPAFFWVMGLAVSSVAGNMLLHFQWDRILSAMPAMSLDGRMHTIAKWLVSMHFLGLVIMSLGLALTAIAFWRACSGSGKPSWLRLLTITFLLLLYGADIAYSLYRWIL